MQKILVIDNEYDIVELIGEILSVNGFEVRTALDGKRGIKTALKFRPNLILCDISMPQLSGYDVLESLRKDKRTHAIPFIFLTAMDGMQALRKGMRLGADDYLTKPVQADELIATVQTRLKKHHQLTRHYKDEIEQTKYHLEITKNYDEKTGLPKISVMEKRINQELKLSPRGFFIFLIIKLNRFKNIVDIFGKSNYLNLIHQLVKRIENASGAEKNVYHISDGEFGVLLINGKSPKSISQISKKILKSIREPLLLENHELNFSASIGVDIKDAENKTVDALISNAEIALNVASGEGYNTFRLFEEEFKKHEVDHFNIENALFKALERDEFRIYYQPKIDSFSQSIIGAEALIRWNNPDYGLLSPTQFVPMAEENGLIIPIGEWLLESICHQLNIWKEAGLHPSPIAVNISARQLEQKNFVHAISTILEKSKVENELLEIELTESILIKNSNKTSNKLSKLRKKGMKVAIDDFGTGYSSLAYLSNFPFDKLKIDRSFIRDITTDKTAASLTTSIISMAHSLGVRVIAEGVETKEQMNFLKEYRCDEIQGYYFSKPINSNDFTKLLQEKVG